MMKSGMNAAAVHNAPSFKLNRIKIARSQRSKVSRGEEGQRGRGEEGKRGRGEEELRGCKSPLPLCPSAPLLLFSSADF